jgi:hypothetical protein
MRRTVFTGSLLSAFKRYSIYFPFLLLSISGWFSTLVFMTKEATLRGLFRANPDLPCVALSIRQPWAYFVVNGYNDHENRSWRT